MLRRTLPGLCALVIAFGAAAPADAQYFGRNRVQYERFDFAILQTLHFDIYYYSSEKAGAAIAARLAERWYDRLSVYFDHTFERRQPIILYASHAHFAQTSVLGTSSIPEGVGGFTDHLAGRVVLPFAAGLGETDHVLGHELVHAFQRDILKARGRSIGLLPLWFTEGMAEYVSTGTLRRLDANTRMWLFDADQSNRLPAIADLEDPRIFPYRYGQAVWTFLAREFGDAAVVRALTSRAGGGVAGRLHEATGKNLDELTRAWHADVRHEIGELHAAPGGASQGDSAPNDAGTVRGAGRVIVDGTNGGQMNVGPAISPDGRSVVFLSERDGYSVDVFLADVETRQVRRKLLSTASDPHFDSLQFVDSAGAWNFAGDRFAIATMADGRAVLSLFRMPDGVLVEQMTINGVDQVFTPAWSRDGSSIAFSAAKGGFTDISVVDLQSHTWRQLTADAFSDLQPVWSPDGKRLAFTTDRFTSSLETLTFGSYELATIDLATGTITRVGGFDGFKNVNPQWSADGASLMFVSDVSGASNIYRIDPGSGEASAVTTVATGVTGITPYSPSLSVAAEGAIASSVYAGGGYQIRVFDGRTSLPAPAVAAPERRREGIAVTSLGNADPATGLFERRPYVPRLSLAAIGQPYLSAGGGDLGSFVRAGVSVAFGDMLGEQQLETSLQVGKRVTDFAVQATYLNRRSRWNWGVIGGRIPSLTGLSSMSGSAMGDQGQRLITRTDSLTQQIHRRISGIVAYPFNHAQRVELGGGFESIAFDTEITDSVFSNLTGELLDRNVRKSVGRPAALGHAGAALVYDTAIHGMTGPIAGQRHRVAAEPTFGGADFVTTTIDLRRYFMPVSPLTIAMRVEHVARLGPGNSDPRLLPLTWTLRDIVRGFSTDESVLRTTRFATANLELRMPVYRLLGLSARPAALPIDAIAFSDWAHLALPQPLAGHDRSFWSAGAGARVTAAGLVFEFAGARALTPGTGWRFAVNFLPGF